MDKRSDPKPSFLDPLKKIFEKFKAAPKNNSGLPAESKKISLFGKEISASDLIRGVVVAGLLVMAFGEIFPEEEKKILAALGLKAASEEAEGADAPVEPKKEIPNEAKPRPVDEVAQAEPAQDAAVSEPETDPATAEVDDKSPADALPETNVAETAPLPEAVDGGPEQIALKPSEETQLNPTETAKESLPEVAVVPPDLASPETETIIAPAPTARELSSNSVTENAKIQESSSAPDLEAELGNGVDITLDQALDQRPQDAKNPAIPAYIPAVDFLQSSESGPHGLVYNCADKYHACIESEQFTNCENQKGRGCVAIKFFENKSECIGQQTAAVNAGNEVKGCL